MSGHGAVMLVIGALLAYFVTLQVIYFALLVLGVIGNQRRNRVLRTSDFTQLSSSDLTVPLSVVIPSYNEAGNVPDTIRSALRSRLAEFEVIVVDDGSSDDTIALLRERYDLVVRARAPRGSIPTAPVRNVYRSRTEPRLWVVEKENGGKADAVNAGVNLAHYRYIVLTDADCLFTPDGLLRMVQPLSFDPGRIVGLGATLSPLNGCTIENGQVIACRVPKDWIVRFQMLEYSSAFIAHRVGWSELNAVPVLSGGVSCWRKDAIEEVGGFTHHTTHEDLEMTVLLHEHFHEAQRPYRIVYVPDHVLWTEVPHTWKGLYMQRKRWQRTQFETVWLHRHMVFNPRYGTAGMLLMPYMLFYEALGPFVELGAYAFTIVLVAFGLVDVRLLLAFLVTAATLVASLRLAALVLELVFHQDRSPRDVLRLTLAALAEYWIYRPFIAVSRLHAFIEFLRGNTTHDRVDRNAQLRAQATSSQAASA